MNKYICEPKVQEPLILEPEDFAETEWKFLEELFGLECADRIVISDYKFEAFGKLKVPEEMKDE